MFSCFMIMGNYAKAEGLVKIDITYQYVANDGNNRFEKVDVSVPAGTTWGEFYNKYPQYMPASRYSDAMEGTEWHKVVQRGGMKGKDTDYIVEFNQYTDSALLEYRGYPNTYKSVGGAFLVIRDGENVDSGIGWNILMPVAYECGSAESINYATETFKLLDYIKDFFNVEEVTYSVKATPAQGHIIDSYTIEFQVPSGYKLSWEEESNNSGDITTPTVNGAPVYRLFNKQNSEHLYTTDLNEATTLPKMSSDWIYEGVGWYAPEEGVPVYRLYSISLQNHLYTIDQNEISVLTAGGDWVLDNGGQPLFYSGGNVPIYRVYCEKLNGMHHLTTDENEYNILPSMGWVQENIALYANLRGM